MPRTVVETLGGWAVFKGPPHPRFYEGTFQDEKEACAVARDRDNRDFWDALRYLAAQIAKAERR